MRSSERGVRSSALPIPHSALEHALDSAFKNVALHAAILPQPRKRRECPGNSRCFRSSRPAQPVLGALLRADVGPDDDLDLVAAENGEARDPKLNHFCQAQLETRRSHDAVAG